MENYHSKSYSEALNDVGSSKKGLSQKEAINRLEKNGPNVLVEKKKVHPFKIFLRQFKDSLILILIFAAIISFFVDEKVDAFIIAFIVLFNGILSFIQDLKAEKSIDSLKKMLKITTTVKRDLSIQEIDAKDLVVGDIVILEEGDKVPADLRIIETFNLSVDESALTGESLPVGKSNQKLPKKTILADRKNMLYSGTSINKGRATCVVVATGANTEIGKISNLISQEKDVMTPLQKNLDKFGKKIGILILAICVGIFAYQGIKTGNLLPSFMVALSLAVAAVPQALPAVITVSLSLGVKRMISKNALIRKLPAVETLGSVDTICTDKTGTLTENKMTVEKILINNDISDVKSLPKDSHLLFEIGAVCNNAYYKDENAFGDPTEVALLNSNRSFGKSDLADIKRITEIPFDSERKMMSVIVKKASKNYMYTKGASDIVLNQCNRISINGKVKKISKKDIQLIQESQKKLSGEALRVLAFAYKPLVGNNKQENNLIFVGLQAMMDPPKNEAAESIKKAHEAGIRVVMITGDHKITAQAIGKRVGIEGNAIEGSKLDSLSELELSRAVKENNIFARVTPEHKLRIVKALKRNGNIVSMTGDGVNDAPALKAANIGVAMGKKGTEVAKQTAELILLDDNFSTIVEAVKQGRLIYDNVEKLLSFLLYANFFEMFVVLGGMFMNFNALPLIAIHLLWIKLLTDGLPALALSIDPPEKNIMKRPPKRTRTFITKEFVLKNILITLTVGMGVLFLFKRFFDSSGDLKLAQTIAFTSMVFFELIILVIVRKKYTLGPFANKYLLSSLVFTMGMQFVVIYFLNDLFKTSPLSLEHLLWIISTGIFLYVVNVLGSKIIEKHTPDQYVRNKF